MTSKQPRVITGTLHACEFFKFSSVGNGQYIVCVADHILYTKLNSSIGGCVRNYLGKQVECQVKLIRDKLVIIDIITVSQPNVSIP